MPERVFTIFQGPDAGRSFLLGDRPITLGRQEECDVALHDDRASRLHARLIPDGDGAVMKDEGSSNGTFVNGELVRERRIVQGDVIAIGASRLVFGREAPSPALMAKIAALAARRGRTMAPGSTTDLLPEPPPSLPLKVAPARLTDLMESVAEAAGPSAGARGIRIAVEADLEPDTAAVDARQLYRALAGLLAHFLEMWPEGDERRAATGALRTLALRLSPDLSRTGFHLEMICVGMPAPREQVTAGASAILFARQVAASHGGALQLLPRDSPGTLVRLRLPLGPSEAPTTMIFGPQSPAPQDTPVERRS